MQENTTQNWQIQLIRNQMNHRQLPLLVTDALPNHSPWGAHFFNQNNGFLPNSST